MAESSSFNGQKYKDLIEEVRKEFEWHRQWCSYGECESYQKFYADVKKYWKGNNAAIFVNKMDNKLMSQYDKVIKARKNVVDVINKKVEKILGTKETAQNLVPGYPMTLKDTKGWVGSPKWNPPGTGFTSEADYKTMKSKFDNMFNRLVNKNNGTSSGVASDVSVSDVKKLWEAMAGTDKASKDAWKEINQVISTHNNQMRQQFGKKTWDELTKDLEGYANKWFKNRT